MNLLHFCKFPSILQLGISIEKKVSEKTGHITQTIIFTVKIHSLIFPVLKFYAFDF